MKSFLISFICCLTFISLQAQHVIVESGAHITADSGAIIFLANTNLANSGKVQLNDGASLIQNAVNPSNSGSGTYEVNKEGSGYDREYNYWASPVIGVTRNAVFPVASTTNLYQFDDPTQTWGTMSGAETLVAGVGYIATGGSGTPETKLTRSFSNTTGFHSGNVNVSLHYDDDGGSNTNTDNDWNLIGNPYPSGISVNQFLTDNSGVLDNAIYIWNSDGNDVGSSNADYATMNAAGVTGAGGGNMPTSNNIASCQGFFVRSIAAGNATFSNSQRVGTNNTFMRSTQDEWNRVWITAEHEAGYNNELLIGFMPDAAEAKDRYDAMKLKGSQHMAFYSYMGTVAENHKMAIQGLPSLDDHRIIPLGIEVNTAGQYSFQISHLVNFPTDDYRVLLEDQTLETISDLQDGPYVVHLEQNNYTNRFVLRFVPASVTGIEELIEENPLSIYSYEKKVYLHFNQTSAQSSTVTVTDVLGKVYLEKELGTQKGRNEIPMHWMSTGIYVVTVEHEWGKHVKRVYLGK
ncbi:MAG: T9SS type A sorting domain-containing protein [Flammeovirgaceae bacterium]